MTDQLALGLTIVLSPIVLLGLVQGIRMLFYQGSVQQRFDDLFTKE